MGAVLYSPAQLPTTKLGIWREASERAEFRRSTQETLEVCSSQQYHWRAVGDPTPGRNMQGDSWLNSDGQQPRSGRMQWEGGAGACPCQPQWGRDKWRRCPKCCRRIPREVVANPIPLALVDGHSQHLCLCIVDTLHSTVTTRAIGASGNFTNTKKLVGDVRKLGEELDTIVRGILRRHAQRGLCRLLWTLAVRSALNSAAVTANMSARRLKRCAQNKM